MKNIDEKILMAEEEIKQLQNKRKKLISQQKQEERKKRDKRLYEKGAVFESVFNESKDFTKDEFYQLITFPNIKEAINEKILISIRCIAYQDFLFILGNFKIHILKQ